MSRVHTTVMKHGRDGSCGYWRWMQELDEGPLAIYGSLASTPSPDFHYAHLNFHDFSILETHVTETFAEAIELVDRHTIEHTQQETPHE